MTLLLFAVLFCVLPLKKLSLVMMGDSYQQHYPFLIAIGRAIRSFGTNFDFSLGLGADRIASLNYYGLGDPLTLIAALFDGESMYVCYVLLVMLRHVLAALAFMALCRGFGVRYSRAMLGAVAYTFSNYMIAWCTLLHPMFANPMIHLPLMILGAEKRLKGEGPGLLIFATAWSGLCGFYFFYMNSIMLFLFALVRHFALYKTAKTLPRSFLRCVVPYLLGVGIASVLLAPAVLGYLSSTRSGGSGFPDLLYSENVYWAYPISFIASNGWNNAMTVPVPAILAVATLFRKNKEHRLLAVSVAVVMVAILLPVVGWAFNGFSYASDRWKYGGVLLLCFVMARFLDDVAGNRTTRGCCLTLLAWSLLLLAKHFLDGGFTLHIALIALAAVLSAGGLVWRAIDRRVKHRAAWLCLFLLVNLFANSLTLCVGVMGSDGIRGSVWAKKTAHSLFRAELPRESFCRVDLTMDEYGNENAPAAAGVFSTAVYDSIRPAVMSDFMGKMALNTDVSANRVYGLDARAALEALFSVKYLTTPSDTDCVIPYGFERISEGDGYSVWENRLAMPMAWTYEGAMSREQFDALSPLERQWALLQCAVTEDGGDVAAQSAVSVPWTVASAENAEYADGVLTFGKGGGSLTLAFEGVPDSETYLQWSGIRCLSADANSTYVTVDSGSGQGILVIESEEYLYTLRRDTLLCNAGWSPEGAARLTISCAKALSVAVDRMEVLCQPMGDYPAMVNALRESGVARAERDGDTVTADVRLAEARYLVFSIPAVDGWRAAIDGTPTALLRDADALCMVRVPAGEHEVVLRYETPGLKAGAVLAAASLLTALAWAFASKRRKSLSL